MEVCQAPEAGAEYTLQLGASLLGKRSAREPGGEDYCTLRYDFKPASAGRAPQGLLDVHLSSQKASLNMGDSAFAGKYEPSKDGLDCVAIFDGTTFRLELLGAAVKNLRHIPTADRAPAAARAAASHPPSAARAGTPSLPAVPATAPLAGEGGLALEVRASTQLEDELLRALGEEEWEEDEAAGAAAGGEAATAGSGGGGGGATLAAQLEAELAAEESGSEEEEEEEEEEEGEGGAEEGAQGAAQHAATALQQQQQPLLAAPPVAHLEMTEDERLFFGFDGSPEPPPQRDGSGSEGPGGSSVRGSDVEREGT